ncbi:MAG: protein kinase [Bryobacteraceae bacterium]
MSLAPATRLGPYEILAPIGAGGMGEVYKARDTKLDREVAIKALPSALAGDPERLARFEREAKVLAQLNHPNIATIYAIEESPEGKAIAMELVSGSTLKGPIPVETALKYARQIAEALEAAHEKGITHRDLKPANIMVTPTGTIKVLDFGLAAVSQSSSAREGNPSNSPTLTISPTRAGMILGTAAYMSPEQASGQPVDKRADIWSFGVVLWEMLTGEQLFKGATVSHILASVLKDEPDFTKVPGRVRRLLRRCLEKDPAKRWRDIGDAMELVEDEAAPVAVVDSRSRLGLVGGVAIAVLSLAAIALGIIAYRATRPPELKPLVRLNVDLGADVRLDDRAGTSVIISPDGHRLAFISKGRLFTQTLDEPVAKDLAAGERVTSPFFSPDSQWVGFFSAGQLKKVSVAGGAVIPLATVTGGFTGAAWSPDGNIIAPGGFQNPLRQVPDSGGTFVSLLKLDAEKKEVTQRWPQILPGGKAVLFVSHTSSGEFENSNVDVASLPDGRRKILQRSATFGRYLPTFGSTGHLLFVSRGTLFAVLFDPAKLETTGAPIAIIEDLAYASDTGYAEFSAAANGAVVFRRASNRANVFPQWLDSSGKTEKLLSIAGYYNELTLSSDGKRLAVALSPDNAPRSIWTYDWARGTTTRITFDAINPSSIVWTPDGSFIVNAGDGVYANRSDGAGSPSKLLPKGAPGSFTPEGKYLAYSLTSSDESREDLWILPIENSGATLKAGKPELYLQTPASEIQPRFSPDGKWIAYVSDESGRYEVYVRAFPDSGAKWQISSTTGVFPTWSRAGRELLYRTLEGQVVAVNYSIQGNSFVAEKPRMWTVSRLAGIGAQRNFDLTPDGKRLVALMSTAESAVSAGTQSHVIYLENFFDELKRKVPLK